MIRFQLIILAAIFYRALRLSIAFQFAHYFLSDEFCHIIFNSRSVLKSSFGTVIKSVRLRMQLMEKLIKHASFHVYCDKKYCSTTAQVVMIFYYSLICIFKFLRKSHIDEIAYLLFIEVKLTNLWTIYWRNESMNVLCCIVKN
ncbi:hypothetical protein T4D_11744 [Trichinella pseudospiralis]|uniref:Uncharacterized protein n=1 Tax=Trichinella pseudospiralis TaxID=6337 RepID=A0A0V1FZ32_TRIPS|nr:hypothetical protein T4D_11744 [Trichinella pseudospiralis]